MQERTFTTQRQRALWALPLAASIAIAGCTGETPRSQSEDVRTMDVEAMPEA